MASVAREPAHRVSKSIRPDRYERVLAAGSGVMLAVVLAALVRGYPHWTEAKPLVWVHLLTLIGALALTPFLLLQKRGTGRHRQLGWVWAVLMFTTAAVSFGIGESRNGGWSLIHILSAVTVVGVPVAIWRARRHEVDKHRRSIRTLVTGALLIAGFFTFPFGRMLGRWLLG